MDMKLNIPNYKLTVKRHVTANSLNKLSDLLQTSLSIPQLDIESEKAVLLIVKCELEKILKDLEEYEKS